MLQARVANEILRALAGVVRHPAELGQVEAQVAIERSENAPAPGCIRLGIFILGIRDLQIALAGTAQPDGEDVSKRTKPGAERPCPVSRQSAHAAHKHQDDDVLEPLTHPEAAIVNALCSLLSSRKAKGPPAKRASRKSSEGNG